MKSASRQLTNIITLFVLCACFGCVTVKPAKFESLPETKYVGSVLLLPITVKFVNTLTGETIPPSGLHYNILDWIHFESKRQAKKNRYKLEPVSSIGIKGIQKLIKQFSLLTKSDLPVDKAKDENLQDVYDKLKKDKLNSFIFSECLVKVESPESLAKENEPATSIIIIAVKIIDVDSKTVLWRKERSVKGAVTQQNVVELVKKIYSRSN